MRKSNSSNMIRRRFSAIGVTCSRRTAQLVPAHLGRRQSMMRRMVLRGPTEAIPGGTVVDGNGNAAALMIGGAAPTTALMLGAVQVVVGRAAKVGPTDCMDTTGKVVGVDRLGIVATSPVITTS